MYFDYFDMLSGEPILYDKVGHLMSPKLRSICPYSGIGYSTYNLYLNFLSWDKEKIIKYCNIMGLRGADKLNRKQFNTFDVVTLVNQTRELCREVLSFFIVERISWDDQRRKYIVSCVDEQNQGCEVVVGEITRENFDNVKNAILQLNFIGLDKDDTPIKHSSEKSKELWERAQNYLKDQANKNDAGDKPEYHISNIISKICAAHPSYNLLNIFHLTVFQLYDSFFQFGYMRSSDLNERIFSNHGGDKFKFEDWLKPILSNI